MEAVLRIVINERSPEESTAEFRLGMKGNMYTHNHDWAPGSYNLSSSLTVIQMDYRYIAFTQTNVKSRLLWKNEKYVKGC